MYMLVGLWSGRITVKSVLTNWGNRTHTHTLKSVLTNWGMLVKLSRMRGNRILNIYIYMCVCVCVCVCLSVCVCVYSSIGIVLVSNFVGCVATVYYFGYLTELHKPEPFLSWYPKP